MLFYFKNDYPNCQYTKRDAYILTGTDDPYFHNSLQLDAALMIYKKYPSHKSIRAQNG